MKEPTFLEYEDDFIEIIWQTKEKILFVSIDAETGIEIFGVNKQADILEFNSFVGAYKWFEEE